MKNDLNKAIQRKDVAKRLTRYLGGSGLWILVVVMSGVDLGNVELIAYASLLFVTTVCYEFEVHHYWWRKLWNWKLGIIFEKLEKVFFR